MAHPFHVALHGVDIMLPDGRVLFRGLNEQFGDGITALTGRNGSGKSTLARVLAGTGAITRGRIERLGQVRYVEQQTGTGDAGSLAALAGLAAPLCALRRLAAGEAQDSDFDLIGERWDLEARWQAMLDQTELDEAMPPAALSGGQRTLLALIGAFCGEADLLVLDEPGNHLDRRRRRFLIEQMAAWRQARRGLVLISHDRELLDHADRTLDIHAGGLRRYGGGWSLVEEQRSLELAAASARLNRARTERDRTDAALHQQAERAARKSARGARAKAAGGQPKIMLNALGSSAQQTDGARAERHARARQVLHDAVSGAFEAPDGGMEQPSFPLHELDVHVPGGQAALVLEDMVAPWGPRQPLTWGAHGPARIAIEGPNGCGKSTLLRTIAGQLAPRLGRCRSLPGVLIDQHLAMLDPARSLLDQLASTAPGRSEGRLRQHLAQACIQPDSVLRPAHQLSG